MIAVLMLRHVIQCSCNLLFFVNLSQKLQKKDYNHKSEIIQMGLKV